jgi:hypothetical protein
VLRRRGAQNRLIHYDSAQCHAGGLRRASNRTIKDEEGGPFMSLKTSRIAVLAGTLAAVGLMSVATTSASALTPITAANCTEPNLLLGPISLEKPVSGSMTVKKLGQSIPLNNGRFAGTVGLCVGEGISVEGTITKAKVEFPPFTAPLTILGLPTEFGLEIHQVGEGEGEITRPGGNEEEEPIELTLNVPAKANIAFTSVKILGLKIPVKCETVEPVKLPLLKKLSLEELLEGTTITGTATLPNIKCGGLFGGLLGPVLTELMSGPENAFSLTFGETKAVEEG